MPNPNPDPLDTPALHDYLHRWRAGDPGGANELLQRAGKRLEKLARKMCRGFPNVEAWAESGDVLQGSLIRLLRSLRTIRPAHTRDFFNLAAVHLRRELLDLARHFRGKVWVPFEPHSSDSGVPAFSVTEPVNPEAADLDIWTRFHEAVDLLPDDEKEVVGLVFYHGWKKARISEFLNVDERTIRRRWASAVIHLRELVGVLPTKG